MPSLDYLGWHECYIFYGFWFTEPFKEDFDNVVFQVKAGNTEVPENIPIILDVERYNTRKTQASDEEFIKGIEQLKIRLRAVKKRFPRNTVGLYDVLPHIDYWAVNGSDHRLKDYRINNQALIDYGLYDEVDFVAPSLYARHNDWSKQRTHFLEIIENCRKATDKPIKAFMWPLYHNMSEFRPENMQTNWKDAYIEGDYWRYQLDILAQKNVDVILWGEPFSYRPEGDHPWDPSAEWFKETQSILMHNKVLGGRYGR